MRFDILLNQLLATLAQERALLQRTTRYIMPLLLLPIGFALAQLVRSWLGLLLGAFGAMVLLVQIELFLRPTLERARTMRRDLTLYLGLPPNHTPPLLGKVIPLLAPAALALAISMVLFLPTMLAAAAAWQRFLALALGVGVLYSIWQRLAHAVTLLDGIEDRIGAAQSSLPYIGEPVGAQLEQAMAHPGTSIVLPSA